MKQPDLTGISRRRLLAMAGLSAGGTLLTGRPLFAQSSKTNPANLPTIRPGTNMSFGSLKQIDARLLNVGYAEAGAADGPAVMPLDGWPYDIHSFFDVVPLLASAGYRVIVPYLRGYGTTRFLSSETFRNGQPSALAVDVIELMGALNIQKAILAGFDWGARTADIIGVLWPERCKWCRNAGLHQFRSSHCRTGRSIRPNSEQSPPLLHGVRQQQRQLHSAQRHEVIGHRAPANSV